MRARVCAVRCYSTATPLHVHRPTDYDAGAPPVRLNTLRDVPGARKKGRRVGRGIGSSKGKTCGKGHKGQKARAGRKPKAHFEGGQTPLYRRLRKHGFRRTRFQRPMEEVNLDQLQYLYDSGRLPGGVVTMKRLLQCGAVRNVKWGLKVLGRGKHHFTAPLRITCSAVSDEALEAVRAVGGDVTTVYLSPLGLRTYLKKDSSEVSIGFASASPRHLRKHSYDVERFSVDMMKELEE